jgi:hypothetical protein
MSRIRWAWLFLDTPRADAERSARFWSEVTGWRRSPPRGEHEEFATLLPPRGDSWLKLQSLADGVSGVHLDLDVEDVTEAATRAEELGGTRVGSIGDAVVVLRSPGGFTFCLTTWAGDSEQVREGVPALVDQVCLDIPDLGYAGEVAFWRDLTGWVWTPADEPELSFLRRPPGIPLRILFQRLGEPTGAVRAQWTVMSDPVGRVYCLTDRSPTRAPGR